MGAEWGTVEALKIASRVAAIASFLGSFGVIGLFIYFKWWKSSTHHFLLLYISISDILFSGMMIVGSRAFGNFYFCQFQGFILQACGQACQCWCCTVGINLLLQIMFYWRDEQCRRLMKYWHFIIWTWSLTSALIPVAAIGGYEELETWCWVGADYPNYRMGVYYYPIWVILLINMGVISTIVKTLFKLIKNLPTSDPIEMRKMRARYRFVVFQTVMFVMVGIIIWTPGTINRVWQYASSDNKSPYTLVFFHMLFTPSQGLLNFLIYVFPLQAQSCCFFVWRIGREEEMRDSADIKSLREIKEQKQPIVRMIRRKRARTADSIKKSTKVVSIEDLRKFYKNEVYTLFADEQQRSTAESISYVRSSRGFTITKSRGFTTTQSEPARSEIRSFGFRRQQDSNNKPNKSGNIDNAVELI